MSLTPQQAKKLADEILVGPDTAPGAADAAPPAESIGNYRILRRIASGGMGTVYEAEQQHPHRIVALKIMKRGIASRPALRRFEFEAEILGRLRHPGIAQIYEAGTHDDGSGGVPYFAMEYIPSARNIIEYADAQDLSVRERLELFARVCHAVHHGHQKGVIHRDLKPGNILVDETGQPKVIDFGVARATDADIALTTMQTSVGELLGTLQYMSPEQCEADPQELDTRTDVYSLGVTLYELLCGQPPCDVSDTSLPKAIRIIQEDEPSRPSSIRKALRGNVEAITLKAIEKSPQKRYQSAAGLAQDIRRHLDGEPIEARTPTAWIRSIHWIGRHPVAATAAACVTIAVFTVAAILASMWYVQYRPHDIELTTDGREARLISFAGEILHTWTSDVQDGITTAQLVRGSAGADVPDIALVGFAAKDSGPQRGSLCAFPIRGDYDQPLWIARITNADIRTTPFSADYKEAEFGIGCARALDIFPDRPGTEIVAIHAHGPYSARVLRIYDLNGDLLYQLWHDGDLHPPLWMPGRRMLLLGGRNQRARWHERGQGEYQSYPLILFAVRPAVGRISNSWVSPIATGAGETLVWYQCLLPAAGSDRFEDPLIMPPMPGDDPAGVLRFGARLTRNPQATVTWLVDGRGNIMPGTWIADDTYNTERAQDNPAPDPAIFRLGSFPAITLPQTPEPP